MRMQQKNPFAAFGSPMTAPHAGQMLGAGALPGNPMTTKTAPPMGGADVLPGGILTKTAPQTPTLGGPDVLPGGVSPMVPLADAGAEAGVLPMDAPPVSLPDAPPAQAPTPRPAGLAGMFGGLAGRGFRKPPVRGPLNAMRFRALGR